METKRLSFDLGGDQIDFKSFARKDFLELSIKAISSANPNLNNTWFTEESIQDAVDSGTCKNKPVLGYFEEGDFQSHNGSWKKDTETGVDYWDTLGTKGERILGVIREQDNISITKDENGLTWLNIGACLWTQYCFKQVKRLLKDAKNAKEHGGVTKNVSVEVDITDYEKLPNGIIKINKFDLVGVTILGSRHGVKVDPGIEGAELSLVDFMDKGLYAKQMDSLRLAYEKLGNEDNMGEKKEMENEEQIECEEHSETPAEERPEENTEHCEAGCDGQGQEHCEEHCEEVPAEESPAAEEEHCEAEEGETVHEAEGCECGEPEGEVAHEEANEPAGEPCQCEQHEEEPDEEEEDYCGMYNALKEQYDSLSKDFEASKDEVEKWKGSYEDYKARYESCIEEKGKLEERIHVYEHKEFCAQAKSMIESAKLGEKQAEQFYAECDKGEIATIEDLKNKVALAVFEKVQKTEETASSFSGDVYNPNTGATPSVAKKSTNKWDRLSKNIAK